MLQHRTRLNALQLAVIASVSMTITACGGGSSISSNTSPVQTVNTNNNPLIGVDEEVVFSGPVAALTSQVSPLDYHTLPNVRPSSGQLDPALRSMLRRELSRGDRESDLSLLCLAGSESLLESGLVLLAELCAANNNRLIVRNLDAESNSGGNISGSTIDVYRVPADTQLVLTRESGNPNLAVFDGLGRTAEVTCVSATPYVQDSCATPAEPGIYYAAVLAADGVASNSQYTINATRDCSVETVNRWTYTNLLDYYIFYDRVPVVDPSVYSTTQELINDTRSERFSSIAPQQTQARLFDEGTSFGLGFSTRRDNDGNTRVAFVYPRSPAGIAGLKRSDKLITVNGRSVDDLTVQEFQSEARAAQSNWVYIDEQSGQQRTLQLSPGEYIVDTVLYSEVLNSPQYNGSVGYLVFNLFLNTSAVELDNTIAEFESAEITDLILDLRYNPGGRISISNKLASQIAGNTVAGSPSYDFVYNDKYQEQNFGFDFSNQANQLGLNRVVVLTSPSTASASEIVINSLRPYIDVITVGEKTLGKPFISVANPFCGFSLNAQEAIGVNASGVSVGDGIAADCAASDDLTNDFGTINGRLEGLANAGLNFLISGQCNTSFAAAPPVRSFTGAISASGIKASDF
jgi:C-terminal processing protease CtpA/Prc